MCIRDSDISTRLESGSLRMGLVVFKGEAMVLVPVTEDVDTLHQALDVVSPDMYSARSSNLEAGLRTAIGAFPRNEERKRLIILFSDGEQHSGEAARAVERSRIDNLTVDVLAVGTEAGGTIPMGDDVLRNSAGDPVVSRVNKAALRSIAAAGDGVFCDMESIGSLNELYQCLSLDERSEGFRFEERGRYRLFLLLTLVALFLSLLVKVVPWRGTY